MDGAHHPKEVLTAHACRIATTLPALWTAEKVAEAIHNPVVKRSGRPSSCACGSPLAYHRRALCSSWLDQQAQEPLFPRIDTPIFQLRRELLRRHFEKVSPWLGVI